MLVKVELAQAAATEGRGRAAAGDPDAAPLPQAAAAVAARGVLGEPDVRGRREHTGPRRKSALPGSIRPTCTSGGPRASQLMFGGPGFYFEHLLGRSGV